MPEKNDNIDVMNNKKGRFFSKWLFRIFVLFLIFVNCVAIGINIPYVRNKLSLELLNYINNKTGFEATIDNLNIDFKHGIRFNGLLIKDKRNNEFLSAGIFETGLIQNLIPMILTGDYDFTNVNLSNANLNIHKYKGDTISNLNYFLKSLSGKKSGKSRCVKLDLDMISLNDINVTNSAFDKKGIDSFLIKNAILDFDKIDLCNKVLKLDELQLSGARILLANGKTQKPKRKSVDYILSFNI